MTAGDTQWTVPWKFAIPAVLFLIALRLAPVAAGGWYAFTNWNGVTAGAHFVGLSNFSAILHSAQARTALWNTLRIAVGFVILTNAIGLTLALGLNRVVKTRYLLRTLFFVPVLMSPLAVGYIWSYIFDYTGGLNSLLGSMGLGSLEQPWLGQSRWALWTVLIVFVWQYSGLTMTIYLAGLQGISDDLYEAAAMDGASVWRQLRRVTLPLLAPAITISATLTLIIGLNVFDQVIALTDGGPAGSTETLATQVYKQTFVSGRFGYGAALSLVLSVIVAILVSAQMIFLRRREARL